ncbi:unnamed protein product [Toxocara canis]|uniref:Mediator of RNA polymerase II transcription subunit 20 n=1 Tax=Toxocara canis TaxID=6265 RepID=A0A183VE14_TOXCA|nr:unnamed protein product [Toxocara canis]
MHIFRVFEYDRSAKSIERAIEGQGAERVGVFSVDSTPYKPSDNVHGAINNVFILHHSHYPHSTFTIAPTERQVKMCPRAVSDRGFDLILSKLSSGLVQDIAGKFEVSGSEFVLKDFMIRVGNATMGVVSKGVIVEVEYAASCVASQCMAMLSEFVAMFFPDRAESKPPVLQKIQPEPYSALDTLNQYLDIFQAMRKKA